MAATIRATLEHFDVESRARQRAFQIVRHVAATVTASHVRLARHHPVKRADLAGGSAGVQTLLEIALPLAGGR